MMSLCLLLYANKYIILKITKRTSPPRNCTQFNLQATKLFIVTSATKGGGGYHPA